MIRLNHSPSINRALRVIRGVFFFSGFTSLIYQIVWQRLLTVHYGVGPVVTTTIVTLFLLGLGIGAYVGGKLSDRVRHPLALYSATELFLCLFGISSPWLLDLIGRETAGVAYSSALACLSAFLFVPAIFMGASFPLLTRVTHSLNDDFLGTVGFLYFVNSIGGALGSFFASYVIISLFGLAAAIYFAAGINAALAITAWVMLPRTNTRCRPEKPRSHTPTSFRYWPYLCIFGAGFLAIGYEIIAFRFLGVLLKDSPYAFSTILSVFLIGISLGSYGIARYLAGRRDINLSSLFFRIQAFIGAYFIVTWTIFYWIAGRTSWGERLVARSFECDAHPAWTSAWCSLDILVYPIVFLLLPTIAMGASFPIITALARRDSSHEGTAVGSVYFWSILGNVMGGIVTGFLFLNHLGTEQSTLLFALVGIASFLLFPQIRTTPVSLLTRIVSVIAILLVAGLMFPRRGELFRVMHGKRPGLDLFLREGTDAVVATFHGGGKTLNFINGQGHGIRPGYVFYNEAIETLAHVRNCKNVLVIGFGTGSLVEIALLTPSVESVTLVELSETLLQNLMPLTPFREILADKRLRVVVDDGRRYLLRSSSRYDLILLDPLRSKTAYSNNLNSREFFELASRHLEVGGAMLVWRDEHVVLPKTLSSVFPHGRMYDYYTVVSREPLEKDPLREREILSLFDNKTRAGIKATANASVFLGDRHFVESLPNRLVNRDWEPIGEYYLWRP